MPKRQRGSVVKRGKNNFGVRWYDDTGKRKYQGGFRTASEAEDWADNAVREVSALRRGDLPKPSDIPTVETLIDSFLDSHEVDPATTVKMRFELAHAKRGFAGKPHRRS
jgi:hypothetical protein